ncbi:ribbon-helix-helix domain-containing protein [Sphingomonas sp. BT552]|uniref:Ribbon-helix-helix domain-containing protein n=1 Tax=Sphingomonas longa TaxID=2778730 RepID=A0ABS2D5G4_9SPHN|nr:ribbon-helix-helix domain-containing protein [Sphingomonas sp. BT552]
MTIAGPQTSISLEPGFWTALDPTAPRRALPLSALVAAIDAVCISRAVSTISTQRGSPGCSGWSRPTATCWKPA